MEHETDERVKQSTCPGCGQHLPSKNGLTVARFRLEPDQVSSLNGLQPASVLELTSNALHFWYESLPRITRISASCSALAAAG